jgi:ATP-dependent exoDNAse (exonuclease V) alpha subunit
LPFIKAFRQAKECDNVTEAIRQALKEKDVIGRGEERKTLRSLSWTKAQKRDGEHYRPGLVVEMNGRVEGFEIGERMTVIDADEDGVLVRGNDGIKQLPLEKPEAFQIYEWNEIEVAAGDKIRITANGYKEGQQHLTNGSIHTVVSIEEDGSLKLEDGNLVGKDFVNFAHGYVTTPHSSQGKTVDWVYVAQSSELSDETGDLKQFYTATTRGRKENMRAESERGSTLINSLPV